MILPSFQSQRGDYIVTGTRSIDKALVVLREILGNQQSQRVSDIANSLDLPPATVYRHISALKHQGFLRTSGPKRLLPGAYLLSVFDQEQFRVLLSDVARPIVSALATELHLTLHLGVFEDDMVTYLVKAEPETYDVFTRENTQLEGYSSGLGKVLLAALPEQELNAYLAGGELVKLTRNTIYDKSELRCELAKVREQGFAIDNGEFDDDLFCVAVPVYGLNRKIVAALSACSYSPEIVEKRKCTSEVLFRTSEAITKSLYQI